MVKGHAIAPQPTLPRIAGIDEPLVQQYFATLNAEEFEGTVALFASDGVLFPPFEDGILGPEAIATYLRREARGMALHPRQGTSHPLDAETRQVEVTGYVKTPLFGINVRWIFVITDTAIQSVGVVLLASLQELLQLRPQ